VLFAALCSTDVLLVPENLLAPNQGHTVYFRHTVTHTSHSEPHTAVSRLAVTSHFISILRGAEASSEANWFAASQEIPRISRNPMVHYRTHKRPPPVPILGQSNPVHIPTFHHLDIHPNITHPSTPRSPHWSPSLRFPQQDPILTYLLTYSMVQSPT